MPQLQISLTQPTLSSSPTTLTPDTDFITLSAKTVAPPLTSPQKTDSPQTATSLKPKLPATATLPDVSRTPPNSPASNSQPKALNSTPAASATTLPTRRWSVSEGQAHPMAQERASVIPPHKPWWWGKQQKQATSRIPPSSPVEGHGQARLGGVSSNPALRMDDIERYERKKPQTAKREADKEPSEPYRRRSMFKSPSPTSPKDKPPPVVLDDLLAAIKQSSAVPCQSVSRASTVSSTPGWSTFATAASTRRMV
jgi:hypothetical protein